MKLVLASRSPARKKLMEQLKIPFECCASDFHEDMNVRKTPFALAKFLALGKAIVVAAKFPDALIFGADTFVMNGNVKVGKPVSHEDAIQIVSAMSGKMIRVYTGVAAVRTDLHGRVMGKKVRSVLTKLRIKKMSPEEIHRLAFQKDVLEISGAFSIEGEGGKMVEKREGDYENVIGLPMFVVREMLLDHGLHDF